MAGHPAHTHGRLQINIDDGNSRSTAATAEQLSYGVDLLTYSRGL